MKKSIQKTMYKGHLTTLILFTMLLCLSYTSITGSVYNLSSPHTITAQAKTSLGKSNALRRALSYLDYTPFSKSGLIKQLKFEGFSSSEAKYAVKNCGANWNKQSVSKAKQYLETTAFSKSGLIKQLKFEGFTSKQAKHGVKYCKANWKKQAVKKAKQYLDTMPFSKSGLISQLKFEGFTSDQAKYAAKKVGYK